MFILDMAPLACGTFGSAGGRAETEGVTVEKGGCMEYPQIYAQNLRAVRWRFEAVIIGAFLHL